MRTKPKAMLIVFLLLAAGGFIWLDRQFRPEPPTEALPMLVRDLPRQVDDIRLEFRRRIHAQYPDGMGASALADDLRRKGFHLQSDHKTGSVVAELQQHGSVCAPAWVIHWESDPSGRAQDIDGYFDPGCP
jgi:hypothetical protein